MKMPTYKIYKIRLPTLVNPVTPGGAYDWAATPGTPAASHGGREDSTGPALVLYI